MQHKYVGDIVDYSKFVLIKHLFDGKCGLIWYLYPNENNSDGGYIDYDNYNLKEKSISKMLKKLICENRSIENLEKELKNNGFNLKFFNECIEEDCKFMHFSKRKEYRENWFNKALETVKDFKVVFVDPDNGIEIKSCSKGKKRSGKYVYFREIDKLLFNHDTIIIYQHSIRKKTKKFVKELESRLREEIKQDFNFYAIRFKKISPRFYLVLSKKHLKEKIEKFCNEFKNEFEFIKVSYENS